LTFEQAASLSAAFLHDTTAKIAQAARLASSPAAIAGYVAYAPAALEPALAPHITPGTSLLLADGAIEAPAGVRGFGLSLLHAIQDLLAAGHASACVLNSDGPTLPTACLVEAAARLSRPGDRAVLGAADDGGYYLLGLKRAHAAMFADIDWSTARVAEQTAERAAAIGLPLEHLPPWYDVDDAAALARLRAELNGRAPTGYEAPATRACLRHFGLDTLTGAA
jgi:glycosyltransferase A (GT-A) superfamily protein (DUF2064 family)